MQETSKVRVGRGPNLFIPLIAGVTDAAVILFVAFSILTEGTVPIAFIFLTFGLVFLAATFAVWRGMRAGYLTLAASSLLLFIVILFTPLGILNILSTPTTPPFYAAVIGLPTLLVASVYSILGYRDLRRGRGEVSAPRAIPASTFFALISIGFIIGGTFIGSLAAGTQTRLLQSSKGGDITIVQGAASQNNPQFFSPSSFAAKAGTTVTWVNKDSTGHTVTSVGSSLFDSGVIPLGGTFQFTFTQPGTYQYYCTIHPWMKGTVVVTSS
jgi:plastocyanin